MKGYRALEEAVSILRRYGRERAALLNKEREGLDILRHHMCLGRGLVESLWEEAEDLRPSRGSMYQVKLYFLRVRRGLCERVHGA
jgi:hypothetical protein